MITRDSVWRSGIRQVKIKDMDDAHLINTIHYIKKSGYLNYNDRMKKVYEVMSHEAFHIRCLSKGFLKYAPMPFKMDNGDWAVWNYEKFGLDILSNKSFENSPLHQYELDEINEGVFGVEGVINSLRKIVKGK